MRFNARRAEHDDGVGDALSLELHERMEILRQNAEWARGGTFEKPVILMGRLWRVLGLELGLTCGHGLFSPNDVNNHCRNRGGSRQRLPARVRRIEYTAELGLFYRWSFGETE